MYRTIFLCFCLLFALSRPAAAQDSPTPTPEPQAAGFGIIGDSATDEYRADNNRGDNFASVTFNWVELLARYRGINFGPWGTWGEPRRTGYEYNWSRSGATTNELRAQYTGVVQQIRDGQVSYVFMQMGSNDFVNDNSILLIFLGLMSKASLKARQDRMIENLTAAVEAITQAGEVELVVSSIIDPAIVPQAAVLLPNEGGLQRVSDAITGVNERLREVVEANGAYFVDYNSLILELNRRIDENANMTIDGVLIDIDTPGNDPHHAQLLDNHAGTVVSGLIANVLFIDTFNNAFGLNIEPFSDTEILQIAGIAPSPGV